MSAAVTEIAREDLARGQLYRLLARLLAAPPDSGVLELCAAIEGDDTELGQALAGLARAAADATAAEVDREYHDLFIGLGRGELIPYGSYYLTGFLHEKPLARLRHSLGELGIEREPGIREPEDHIAALFDVMGGLVLGDLGPGGGLEVQKRFFTEHVGTWAGHFFRDLEVARTARFYRAVGTLGRSLTAVEEAAFEMV